MRLEVGGLVVGEEDGTGVVVGVAVVGEEDGTGVVGEALGADVGDIVGETLGADVGGNDTTS